MIINPLKSLGNVDIFIHTYSCTRSFDLVRSREKNVILDPQKLIDVIKPIKYIIEDQSIFDTSYVLNDYKTCKDPFGNNYQSVQNYIRSMHSLDECYKLAASTNDYDICVVVRPDLLYMDAIKLDEVCNCIHANYIYTPDFHQFGGLNDRFAFGRFDTMKVYCTRQKEYMQYSKSKSLHSESFLKHVLRNENNKFTHMYARRVRFNGVIIDK